jgi:uncharacterized protein
VVAFQKARVMHRVRSVSVVVLICITAIAAAAQSPLPKPQGRVNDFANVIDPATEAEIDRRLDVIEQKTSAEIAVATIQSLNGISVEEYANRLFKEWGVGQAKQDNGVLVLIAPNDREMRIEVGYGLEGVLPDGLAGQVIRDDFTPRFRENDYSGGIRNGVNRIADIVEKQQVLTPEELAKFNDSGSSNAPTYVAIPFFGMFVAIGFVMVGGGLRSKTGFPLLFGSVFGGMPLLMSLALLGKLALMTLFPFAALMFVMGYRAGAKKWWRDAFRNTGKGRKGGKGGSSSGWTMGSSSGSGSSSSSSSSSGGFSGGSSGGGGASGKW